MTEIILTSSVLILVLAVLRRTLRGRISPCVQYALWLLVAARLLIPGTLFTAPVSVLGAAEGLQTTIRGTFPDTDNLPEPVINDSKDQLGQPPSVQPAVPVSIEHPDKDTAVTTYDVADAPEITQRVYNWPDIIWKTGIAVTGSAILISNLAFYLRLRRKRKPLTPPVSPWSGTLPVYEMEDITSPCLFGLFRPAIYLNEEAVKAEHPEHILAHEYAHYCHGDHLWSILRSICLIIHWYNPLVWWAVVLSRRDCELACDASALRRLGEEKRIDYGRTLLELVPKRTSPAVLLHTATTMTAGKRAMTERIALIIRQPKTKKITMLLVILTMCLLAACTFGGKAEEPDQTDDPPDTAAEASPLLEYPGLHWNDSVETVMEALGVTEEDFIESGEDTDHSFSFAVGDVPLYGRTAQYLICRFIQYAGTGHKLGLYAVQVSYPDDMEDFDAVREELVRRYGPAGKETHGGNYPATDGFKSLMGDRYDRWEELQQREDINTLYWDAGADVLPEAYMGPLETELESWRQMHPETTLEEFLDVFPVARLTWCSCSVFTPTFNTVTFDGGGYVSFLQLSSSDSSTASHAGIIVNSIQNGGDPGEWLSYMNYMDWNDIRQAAVDAGLDAAETEQKIIDDIWQYIDQQDIALTQEEYVSILTATAGLTGTPKEGGYQNRSDIPWSQMPVRYGDVVYKLYATNPGMFACMVLEQMPEAQQGEILDYFRYECNMPYYRGEYPYWKNVPSQAEALHELEADLARSRSQEISAYTFHSPGESAQYHFPDDRTGGTSTFESDDPEIATVDMIGLIVAVSPGETDIRIHSVSADGEEEDLVCHVRCDWTDDPAANAGTIRACIQRDASASAWIPLLKDTSWDELALNDVQDGRDWLLDALTDLWEYVQTAFPSQEEYRAILSCTGGLDGAYSELYAAILYRMYVWSPVQFAAITLRDLSAAQRDAATELLLYDWGYFHRLDDALSYPERLAILQTRLEEDRRVMHLLSPDAVILTAPGETDKLRLTTTVAISEISAETSDPQVVKVEPDGAGDFRITAVGPGEAEITVRCTITGLEHTYICSVLCAW